MAITKIEYEKREKAIELPNGTVLDVPERTKANDDKIIGDIEDVPISKINAPSSVYGIIGVTNFNNRQVNKRASMYKRRSF